MEQQLTWQAIDTYSCEKTLHNKEPLHMRLPSLHNNSCMSQPNKELVWSSNTLKVLPRLLSFRFFLCIIDEAWRALPFNARLSATSEYISWFTLDKNLASQTLTRALCCVAAKCKHKRSSSGGSRTQRRLLTIVAAVFVVFVRCLLLDLAAERGRKKKTAWNFKVNLFLNKQKVQFGLLCL